VDEPLYVEVDETGETPVVRVVGELDIYTAPRLRDTLLDVIGRHHATVVVDLERLEFIDSTGLGVLVSGVKRLRQIPGASLVLSAPPPSVMRVLDVTGLTKVFRIERVASR
jgi:anti-sigma B factor antagonist